MKLNLAAALGDAKALAAHLLAFAVSLVTSAQLFNSGHLTRDTYIQAAVMAALSALVHALQPADTTAQQASVANEVEDLVKTFAPGLAMFLGKPAAANVIEPNQPPTAAAPKPPVPPGTGTPAL